MWRSVAVSIAAVSRKSSLAKRNLSLQPHLLHSNTRIFSDYVAFLSPRIIFHQNPRFFSQDSSNPDDNDAEIPQFEPVVSVGVTHSDAHQVFDEVTDPLLSIERDEYVNIDDVDGTTTEADVVKSEEIDLGKLEHVLSLLQSGDIEEDSLRASLESEMSVELLEKFFLRVIETPHIPGANLIGFVRLVLEKDKLAITTPVVEWLVQMISVERKQNSAFALWDLLKELGDDGLLNTEILNGLLSLLSALGEGEACFEVFNKFEELKCVPNAESFYLAIETLCRRSIYHRAVSVCETMVDRENLPDSEKVGHMISCLCKGQKANAAHDVYMCAKKQDKSLPRSSFNMLIRSLCREDSNVHLALEMLDDISREERKKAIKLYTSVIQGLCRMKDTERAKCLLFDMIESGPPPGNSVFNSIINSLSKAGEMKEATKIMKVMESRGLKPDVYTYSVIMSGYTKGGEMEEARKVLAEAKTKHSKLCPVTYHTLIRGYCKLERYDEALNLLSEMKQHGVQPNADEYNKLIQSLCLKALDWKTAEELLKEMEDNGLHLNGVTRGLIKAVKQLEEEELETADAASIEEHATAA